MRTTRTLAAAALVLTAALAGCMTDHAKADAPVAAKAPEFKPLFNGTDLTGWEGDDRFWSVKDGVIVGETTAATPTPHNTFLIYKGNGGAGQFADFVLKAKFKLRNHNSGIQYRSRELGDHVMTGYQADIAEGQPSRYTGILYEEKARGILANRGEKVVIDAAGKKTVTPLGTPEEIKAIGDAIHMDQWNDYVITAKGNHLVEQINGMVTVDVTDDEPAKSARDGLLGLQIHAGQPMKVEFKDISIKELK